MLVSLFVQNFAIIDNIQVEFHEGMNVLTGETGAGKSLIIDAIGLLFGKRASSELVRFQEKKATIEGVFSDYPTATQEILEKNGVDYQKDEFLILKREIYANGKSICKINDSIVSLNVLNEISETIGDIHSQFDAQGLFQPKNYLQFIDDESTKTLLLNYQKNYKEYSQLHREYLDLVQKNKDNDQKIDFLKYQIQELDKANLSSEEEEDLKSKLGYLTNFEEISKNANEVIDVFQNQQVLDLLYESLQCLQKIEKYDSQYQKFRSQLEEAYYSLSDMTLELSAKIKKEDIDLSDLAWINERLGVYAELKRKYKKTTSEIELEHQKMKEMIILMENFDDIIADYEKKLSALKQATMEDASKLSVRRQKISKDIESNIEKTLKDLHLKNTKFHIAFDEQEQSFKPNGVDKIDFLITFNEGEPMKPLSKVASGGELSRFMLSLKTLLSQQLNLQTIIFDEIDNGVSGSIAYSIANKIYQIAENAQVLCVTHLPQVAASANHHFKITKHTSEDNRTITEVKKLSMSERIEEVAMMISKGVVTQASTNLAKELLNEKV